MEIGPIRNQNLIFWPLANNGKIDGGQQKMKNVRTNRQSNLRGSCQSIFSLSRHHPTRNRLVKIGEGQQKIKIVRTNRQSNLRRSCQSFFSLCRHHPIFTPSSPTAGWPERIWRALWGPERMAAHRLPA